MEKNERCKESVMDGFNLRRCSRKQWKDEFCKQHHPDTVAERNKQSQERYELQRKQSCWYRLDIAHKRIAELEAQIERMRDELTDARAKR